MLTLKESQSVHNSMNRPKLNVILIFTFYIIVKYQFSPNLAGFLDILNEIRHSGGLRITKSQISALNVMATHEQRQGNFIKQTLWDGIDFGPPKWHIYALADSQWKCKYISDENDHFSPTHHLMS